MVFAGRERMSQLSIWLSPLGVSVHPEVAESVIGFPENSDVNLITPTGAGPEFSIIKVQSTIEFISAGFGITEIG